MDERLGFNLIEAKSIFQSQTFWGAVISLYSVLAPGIYAKFFGATPQLTIVGDILTGIGFIWTVWGRLTAKQVVSLTGGPIPPAKIASGSGG
jgi:hypothetical protein